MQSRADALGPTPVTVASATRPQRVPGPSTTTLRPADDVDSDGGLVDKGRVVITRNVGTANAVRSLICVDDAEFLEGEFSTRTTKT